MITRSQSGCFATLVAAAMLIGGSLTSSAANAATYYVGKSGGDGNSCSSAQSTSSPKLTIKSGLSCLKAGDTLFIRAGTYGEAISNPPSGTSWSSPVTIAAYAGEAVTVKSASSSRPLSLIYSGSPIQYIIFDGLSFDASKTSRLAANLDGVNFTTTVHHIRFRNCEFANATAQGVLTGRGANFLEFIGCKFHHNGTDLTQDHGLYLESSDTLIEKSEFYNNSGAGLHIYTGFSGDSANRNIVRKNRLHDNSFGMVLGSGDANFASNNLIYKNSSHAVEIGFNATNTKFYNNTVYQNGGDGIQIRSNSSGTTVRNNIAYSNRTNIANYATSSTTLSNNLTTDPSFVNVTAGDFHLKLGSAAVDKGITLSAVSDDYKGSPRPGGASYDIGASEYTTSIPILLSAPTSLQLSIE